MFEAWTSENSELVKAFFGKPGRVLVAAWILDRRGEAFYQQEATDGLRMVGESASATQKVLEQFAYFELLSTTFAGRRRYYSQLDHSLWQAYESLGASLGLLTTAEAEGDVEHAPGSV
jgi:hypothetical protein